MSVFSDSLLHRLARQNWLLASASFLSGSIAMSLWF